MVTRATQTTKEADRTPQAGKTGATTKALEITIVRTSIRNIQKVLIEIAIMTGDTNLPTTIEETNASPMATSGTTTPTQNA